MMEPNIQHYSTNNVKMKKSETFNQLRLWAYLSIKFSYDYTVVLNSLEYPIKETFTI
jgi:hypothetical protein